MNDRWNQCASAARAAQPEGVPPMPYGFAARVLRTVESAVTDRLDLWMIFARRGLAFASLATIIATGFVWWDYPALAIEAPAVADEALEQALWQP